MRFELMTLCLQGIRSKPTELYRHIAQSGIRTHEAYAVELESTPFDHSGICAKYYP